MTKYHAVEASRLLVLQLYSIPSPLLGDMRNLAAPPVSPYSMTRVEVLEPNERRCEKSIQDAGVEIPGEVVRAIQGRPGISPQSAL
jgi:hypothetical protein